MADFTLTWEVQPDPLWFCSSSDLEWIFAVMFLSCDSVGTNVGFFPESRDF